ncbi:MAG: virulence-associated E family protein [Bacteroidales bacterium]|nr:virulence-associated E family protein [Bacteroidales bacterium]
MERNIDIYEIDSSEKKQKKSVFEELDDFINENFELHYNEIALIYEVRNKKKGKEKFAPLNKSTLLIALVNSGRKVSAQTLDIYLKSDYVVKRNPIIQYFKSLPKWDGYDYITKYASYVHTDDDKQFAYHLKKWCVRAVLSVHNTDRINKHCIVLANGDQHAGKSTYLNYLIPKELKPYSSENIGLDKDSRIKLCKTFIINIEELDIMGKYDVNSLKAYISQTWVNERLPYAERAENIPRICSFIASTNRTEILNDDTGNVRWIVFEVKGRLNFAYSKEFDIDNLWSQAYYLAFNEPDFNPELTIEDVLINEKRNEAYMIQSVEREVIRTYYETSDVMDDFRTATDIVEELKPLGHKLSNRNIGCALTRYKFERIKHSKRGVYGYLAKPLFKVSPLEMRK